MRWVSGLLAALLLFCGGAVACAQATSAPAIQPAPVHLGLSAISLHGPWRFKTGDNAAWSAPDLNDASWETVDLAQPGAGDDNAASSDLIPGWTALGHPDYSGFAWYRLHLQVSDSRTPLALKMPDAVDDAYQVFVNGQKIGQFGDFSHHGVRAYAAMPQGYPLPPHFRDGDLVIAIRVWMDSATRMIAPDAGGLRAAPVLGLRSTIAGQVQLDWDDQLRQVGSGFLESLILLLVLIVALTHFALARHEKAYLWLGLVVSTTLLGNLILQVMNFTTLIPQTPAILLRDVLLTPMRIGLWILFWASWFGLGTPKRLAHLTADLVLLLAAGTAMLRPPLHGQLLSLHADRLLTPSVLWIKLALGGLLVAVTVLGIRWDRVEGLIVLPAVLLAAVANYQHDLRFLHLPNTFFVFGFVISLGQISTILSLLLITWMGSRRFLRAQRRKVQWELEMQQARELQKVMLPSTLPRIAGLRVEADYRPSREVGGDFFQVIPHREDGSVLVLIGDVTGKGLRAGMLVALIVGAADSVAHDDPDPERLLAKLNDRLCERGYATATCLAMRIATDGTCTIANAGHLPPFLNGHEMELEGALPMGTLPGVDYTRAQVQLREGDQLTLMTDGVAEAQDDDGELFGFDRVGAMIADKMSIAQMADAAAAFGQEDDILVLRIERVPQEASATLVAA